MGPCLSSAKTVDDESKQAKEANVAFFNKLVENDPTSFNLCKLEPIQMINYWDLASSIYRIQTWFLTLPT